jgi:hypothetical protein
MFRPVPESWTNQDLGQLRGAQLVNVVAETDMGVDPYEASLIGIDVRRVK